MKRLRQRKCQKMRELLACRICLNTNVKLYDIYKYQLASAYENLTGSKVLPLDGFPHYTCSVCSTLLLKCISFKSLCQRSQELLKYAIKQNHQITTEYITSLQINSHILSKFSISRNNTSTSYDQYAKLKEEVWDEGDLYQDTDLGVDTDVYDDISKSEKDINVKSEPSSSDEEPLSSKKAYKTKEEKGPMGNLIQIVSNKCQENDPVSECETNEVSDCLDDNEVEVTILTKEQQINEVKARMSSLNYLHSLYKCDKCYKGFLSAATYKNHMISHDPSTGRHTCEICQTRWPTVRSLRTHVVTSHERKFVCKLCAHVSKSRHKAKEHFKWHSGHKFVCNTCGASFEKSTSHLTHVRIHHPSQHSCEVCGESFIGENGLNMHRKKAHRSVEVDEKQDKSRCTRCDVSFQSVEALQKHTSDNENNCRSTMPCVKCGENFNTDKLLKEHLRSHFKDQPVKCVECNRSFAHERLYTIHFQRVHLGLKIKCASKAAAATRPPVVCEICGKKCITKSTLMNHQRTHTGEKPYACTQCPKKFSVHQRLQIHLRTHTGECPYKCSNCPKAFKHKAALNRHNRVHTGAKPYSCSHCGKCFSQSNSMKLHVRTVHLKMPAPYRGRQKDKLTAT